MNKILYIILKYLSIKVVTKYNPKIIGITGSVGKTSTKEAIFSVLKDNFNIQRNIKNYNNEIGVPLTILNKESGQRNIFKWLRIILSSLKLIILKDKEYPDILILEMGADKKGDIDYLTSITKPDIAVLTAIGHSHIENFGSINNILKEKLSITKRLNKEDWVVLNNDDKLLYSSKDKLKSNIKTFGQKEDSDIYIKDIKIIEKDNTYGTTFKIRYKGSIVPVFLPNVLGWQHAQSVACACSIALILDMNLVDIAKDLMKYIPAKGRTNLIKGVKNSYIIDDTYNASPQSSELALNILSEIPSSGRKIVVFGDMLELGDISEESHRNVGKIVKQLNIDYLFVIGERSRDIARGAKELGMYEDHIFHFPFTTEAGIFLQERIKENDIILVKGSRGSKMEQVVYEIMAKPWKADELLVARVDK